MLVEIALLLFALAAVALLALDLFRGRHQADEARDHLERLRAGESEEESAPLAPPTDPLTRKLRAAGLALSPGLFILGLVVLGVLVLVGLLVALPRAPLAAGVGALVTAYAVYLAINEWGKFRARRFERRLVDGVDHTVSALMAGEAPVRALASAAAASEGDVREELEEVVNRLGVGLDIRQALERMVTRFDSEGVRLLTQTLAVKWRAGGDLTPVLRSVGWIMRERIRIGMRLRAELTGIQLAGLMIALLPYLLIPVFLWIRPSWVDILKVHPLAPRLLLGAVTCQLMGLVWLRRILRIEL
jgi:Flp pilus assembly protein TadB